MVEGNKNLGGVTPEEIAEFSKSSVGPPGIANTSSVARFVVNVAQLIVQRAEAGESGGFAFFLCSDRIRTHAKFCVGDPEPFLQHGNQPILGKVWIASASMGGARRVDTQSNDVGGLFSEIEGGPLAHLPAVIVDWEAEEPRADFYPKGISESDKMISIDLSGSQISANDITWALNHFYQRRLMAPQLIREGGGNPIWQIASKGVPCEKVEERIQGRLMDSLQSRYPRHELHGEPVVKEGRADIVIYFITVDVAGEPVSRNDWLLELKALREKTHTGAKIAKNKADKAIEEGLSQVIRYRTKLPARNAAVCCYDLRKENPGDDSCFNCIKNEAAAEKVYTWRWYLYRNARAVRSAIKSGELVET